MPPFPDEYLHPQVISLVDFVRTAKQIGDEDEGDSFINFVLAGRCRAFIDDEDPPRLVPARMFVNPYLQLAPPNDYIVHGDFDSVIGLTRTLPFTKGISWQCFPQFTETLTTDVHIKVPIVNATGTLQVPLHKIPNYMCLKFDIRHQGRLFFPRRYEPHVSPSLPEEFCTAVYDHAILPAIRTCNPALASHWPHSYAQVLRLSRVQRGQFSSVSRDIPSNLLAQFAQDMLRRLDDMGGGFRDAFFELEAKGIKATSFHDPSDNRARRAALQGVLDPLDIRSIPVDELKTQWWVDVALEVHEEGSVLLWLSESHPRLIRHALPHVTPEQAASLIRSEAYKRDFNGHLTSISGFRLEPRSRGTRDHVTYMNVYTTDKSVTYQTKPGLYRRRVGSDLYPNAIQQILADLEAITTTFSECGGHEGVAQDACTRIEVRTNIHYARTSLTGIPDELIQMSVLSVPSVLWWYFKFYRMTAIYRVFAELAQTPPPARAWLPSLMLGSVCVYMFNAVIFRPSTRRVEQELARACAYWCHPDYSPVEEVNVGLDLEDNMLQPCNLDRGLYFVSGIVRDEEHRFLRLPTVRQLDRTDLAILYGKTSLKDVLRALGGTALGLHGLSRAHKLRTKNKGETVPVTQLGSQLTLHDFNFAAQGVARQLDIQMTGPDINRAEDEDDEDGTLDQVFSTLWAQFPSDMVQQSPNFRHRTLPSYIKLTLREREEVSVDLFKEFALPFDSVYLRLCTPSQWRELVFDKFFPPQDTKIPDNLQNFRQSRYFSSYVTELGRLSETDAARIRESIWTLFQELRWVPHPYSERMWATKRRTVGHGWFALPQGHHDLAVHIAINPKYYTGLNAITLSSGPRPADGNDEDDDTAWVELSRRIQIIRQSIPSRDSIVRPGEGQEVLTAIRRLSHSNSAGPHRSSNAGRSVSQISNNPQPQPLPTSAAGSSASQAGRGRAQPSRRGRIGPLPPPLQPSHHLPLLPSGNIRPHPTGANNSRNSQRAPIGHHTEAQLPLSRGQLHLTSSPSEPEAPRRSVHPFQHDIDIPSPGSPPHSDAVLTSPPSTPQSSWDVGFPSSNAVHHSRAAFELYSQSPIPPSGSVRTLYTLPSPPLLDWELPTSPPASPLAKHNPLNAEMLHD